MFLAWAIWHLTVDRADYTAAQVHTWAAYVVATVVFFPSLAWAIIGVVEIEREHRAEQRARPVTERMLNEAMAGLERLAQAERQQRETQAALDTDRRDDDTKETRR